MKYAKRAGVITMSTLLSLGSLAPAVSADELDKRHEEGSKIEIMSAEKMVTQEELVQRVKEFFPDRFDDLSGYDIFMEGSHTYPDDDLVRYGLSFHKMENGEDIHANVGFVGEDLKIERFDYQPATESEALFPAAISKGEAKEIAQSFLEEKLDSGEYKLDEDRNYYPQPNQTLTEPIEYNFSFVKTKDDVPVSDQIIRITVLGNGEVTSFYRDMRTIESATYEEVSNVLADEKVLEQVKDNLDLELRYDLWRDPETGEQSPRLIYQPSQNIRGVDAISGEWKIGNEFSEELPEEKELEMITDQELEPRDEDFSKEEAKELANEILKVDSDDVTLSIQSVQERENYNNQRVISVQYMYEYRGGGHGTSMEFDPDTGEVLDYRNIKGNLIIGSKEDSEEKKISSEEALEKAVSYLKEYAPSRLHQYALPQEGPMYNENQEEYHMSFKRIVNGIPVNGDAISVRIGEDGTLLGLQARSSQIEEWPSKEEVVSKEEAREQFLENLSLDLQYVKDSGAEEAHYDLLYTPLYSEGVPNFFNAQTGEWENRYEQKGEEVTVSHPWAEKELNFLIGADILDVEDPSTFNADESVTKGEALEVIMKSLTRFYEEYYPEDRELPQSFDNIGTDHDLYQIVERAVEIGILDEEQDTFATDELMSREELAVWYIRALGLEKAADFSDIYDLDFKDASEIEDENIGYVALASALGLLNGNHNEFSPDDEVTYAQLAVSNIRLAHEAYQDEMRLRY